MKISLNWLKEYIDLKDIPEKELLERLTLSTCEVEGVRKLDEHIKHTVVGQIVEIQNHPNADKLKVCKVTLRQASAVAKASADRQGDIVHIVCGGTNLSVGAKVVVALPGALVKWHGQEGWVEMKETEIRGVKSFGMICAAEELGVPWRHEPSEGEHPIMILSVDAPRGESIDEYLGLNDTVLDIDNKSITHRADLFSHIGIASELSAIFRLPFQDVRYPGVREAIPEWEKLQKNLECEVEIQAKDAVHRSTFFLLKSLRVCPSPLWMQNRLRSIGARPINNLVDATNYVMWEIGTPLHAFDVSKIGGSKMIVRFAKGGEKVITLDGVERTVDGGVLLGEDGEGRIIDLPGIMGGELSEVDQNTTSILLQSAAFDRVVIRKSTLKLAHRTDGAAFHERAADPHLTPGALIRTLELLKETCPEARVHQVIDWYPEPSEGCMMDFDPGEITRQLGIEISEQESKGILERLGFVVRDSAGRGGVHLRPNEAGARPAPTDGNGRDNWRITIPPRRKDIHGFQDICEEIGRVFGYDRVQPKEHFAPLRAPVVSPLIQTRERFRDTLVSSGFNETYNYIFWSGRDLRWLNLETNSLVVVQNPISEDLKYLRTSLLPGLLKVVALNQGRFESCLLFEVGKVFALPNVESERFACVITCGEDVEPTFRRMIGVWENVARDLSIFGEVARGTLDRANRFAATRWLSGREGVSLAVGGKVIGVLGAVKQKLLDLYGVKREVIFLELDAEVSTMLREQYWDYQKLPQFPSVLRDVSLIAGNEVSYESIVAILSKAEFLTRHELFDVFTGNGISEGKKSSAFHLEFSSPERTLENKEVDESLKKILLKLAQNLDARIRA